MNHNYYLVYDFETGSANPNKTQPLQFCGAMVNPRKLEIESVFQSYIKPFENPEEYNLDPLEEKALEINKVTREILEEKGKSPKVFWEEFSTWASAFNIKNNKYTAPIRVGFNIRNFDNIIMDRMNKGHLSEEYQTISKIVKEDTKGDTAKDKKAIREALLKYKEPYKFGGEKIYNNVFSVDLFDMIFPWVENKQDITSYKLSAYRDYFGMECENSHNAYNDVIDTAEIFVKFVETIRKANPNLKGRFSERKFQYSH